jgi:rubrerythrin
MKLIRDLEEMISEEIEGVRNYARMAAHVKDEHPGLAQTLYNISVQEDSHQAALHNEVVKIIEEHRRTHGEPPAAMMAVYDFMHKRHIDDLADARKYQDVYKSS